MAAAPPPGSPQEPKTKPCKGACKQIKAIADFPIRYDSHGKKHYRSGVCDACMKQAKKDRRRKRLKPARTGPAPPPGSPEEPARKLCKGECQRTRDIDKFPVWTSSHTGLPYRSGVCWDCARETWNANGCRRRRGGPALLPAPPPGSPEEPAEKPCKGRCGKTRPIGDFPIRKKRGQPYRAGVCRGCENAVIGDNEKRRERVPPRRPAPPPGSPEEPARKKCTGPCDREKPIHLFSIKTNHGKRYRSGVCQICSNIARGLRDQTPEVKARSAEYRHREDVRKQRAKTARVLRRLPKSRATRAAYRLKRQALESTPQFKYEDDRKSAVKQLQRVEQEIEQLELERARMRYRICYRKKLGQADRVARLKQQRRNLKEKLRVRARRVDVLRRRIETCDRELAKFGAGK